MCGYIHIKMQNFDLNKFIVMYISAIYCKFVTNFSRKTSNTLKLLLIIAKKYGQRLGKKKITSAPVRLVNP